MAERVPAYLLEMAGVAVAATDVGVVRYRSLEPTYRIGVVRRGGRSLDDGGRGNWFVLGPYGQAVSLPDEPYRTVFSSQEEASRIAEHGLPLFGERVDD
ncbi:MAG: hypothetical protein ACQETD_10915 [Pseudomonadota bacterium]